MLIFNNFIFITSINEATNKESAELAYISIKK